MARPRTPTNILELRGAYRTHPGRRREREGEPEPKAGIGPAPRHLKPDERRAWRELVEVAPTGVLGDSDRAYLEITAELVAHKRRLGVDRIKAAHLGLLDKMLGKLGLVPSRR